jgi:hypothetical protein
MLFAVSETGRWFDLGAGRFIRKETLSRIIAHGFVLALVNVEMPFLTVFAHPRARTLHAMPRLRRFAAIGSSAAI